MIQDNLLEVKRNIDIAISKSKRRKEDVTLIAVSKTKPIEDLKEAYSYGIRDFGENKVQEIQEKYPLLPKDTRFHMIGHLQTNKVKYIIDKVVLIHSVDSVKLAKVIQKEAEKNDIVMPILLEVNVALEDSKFGINPKDIYNVIEQIENLQNIRIEGLMTVAPYVTNPEDNRKIFKSLRQLSIDIQAKNYNNVSMRFLSMGMSNDYIVAIEEGANFVRVGSSIFGKRQ